MDVRGSSCSVSGQVAGIQFEQHAADRSSKKRRAVREAPPNRTDPAGDSQLMVTRVGFYKKIRSPLLAEFGCKLIKSKRRLV